LSNRELKSDNPKRRQIWQPESSFNAPKSAQETSNSSSLSRETRKTSEVTTYGYPHNISDLQLSKTTSCKNNLTEK
jgi:hypothetical protein